MRSPATGENRDRDAVRSHDRIDHPRALRAHLSFGDFSVAPVAGGAPVLCHGPSSCGWLLLGEDAVVPDGIAVPPIVLDMDCRFDGWAPGR
jgi:hypothetical protein